MAATGGTVHVEGLDELVRGFGRVNHGLRREAQKQLRSVGLIVAREAQQTAAAERLHSQSPYDQHPGQLIRLIRPQVRGGSVFVRDSARTPGTGKWGNYNYPARYEFQRGGERAFLSRGLERSRGRVVREMERIVDWIALEWGK